MRKAIKIFLILVMIIFLLVILYLGYNLLGNKSVNLKEITSSEKEEILEVIGLNNLKDIIKLEKLETPKTYKDIYYILYFSINLNDNIDTLNNTKIADFSVIKEKDNVIKYRCTISDMGKDIKELEQIIDKYRDQK